MAMKLEVCKPLKWLIPVTLQGFVLFFKVGKFKQIYFPKARNSILMIVHGSFKNKHTQVLTKQFVTHL